VKTSLVIALLALLAPSLTGCKQGAGERCQVDSDCADGNCSQAEPRVCGGSDSAQLDAAPPPIDAPEVPIDAAIDAAIDAP
jgi:predicted small secreted protein